MKMFFELSKEHSTLPADEVVACLHAEQIKFRLVECSDDVVVVEIEDSVCGFFQGLFERLSYSFNVSRLLFSCKPLMSDIKDMALKNPLSGVGSVGVFYRNRSQDVDSKRVVQSIAEVYTCGRSVDLHCPDEVVRVIITDEKVYVGVQLAMIDRSQYEQRKVQHRPFFSPISLHPKLARVLVNISQIRRDQVLLDPFCGTGGIILEAGLLGIQVIGGDVEEQMITGCKETLEHFMVDQYQVFCGDVSEVKNHVSQVDGVVTDLPYGKSTTTKGEHVSDLFQRSLKVFSEIVRSGGRVVVGCSDKKMVQTGGRFFTVEAEYVVPVHRSLTRYFTVYVV